MRFLSGQTSYHFGILMRGAGGVNSDLEEMNTFFITIPHPVNEGWSEPTRLQDKKAWTGSFEDHLGGPCGIYREDLSARRGRKKRVLYLQPFT